MKIFNLFNLITRIHLLLVLSFFSCSLFSQSNFLGYRNDCIEIQTQRIDSLFRLVVGDHRYAQLSDLQCSDKRYRIIVSFDVDSNGVVKKSYIRDKNSFLLPFEISLFKSKVESSIFDICLTEFEHKHLSKEELFSDTKTLGYGVFLPLKR